jgi:O-methyltransferase
VWRGGATIFMRGYLAAHGITDRTVWVADSFAGLPPPTLAQDAGHDYSAAVAPILAISREEVEGLFRRYDLLDRQVKFLQGWFKDTLPTAPIDRLAVLRLDGDLYESTMDALNALYAKVSAGGFVIVDDYHDIDPCKQAVDEFRARYGVTDPITDIDWSGVYWRKGL